MLGKAWWGPRWGLLPEHIPRNQQTSPAMGVSLYVKRGQPCVLGLGSIHESRLWFQLRSDLALLWNSANLLLALFLPLPLPIFTTMQPLCPLTPHGQHCPRCKERIKVREGPGMDTCSVT